MKRHLGLVSLAGGMVLAGASLGFAQNVRAPLGDLKLGFSRDVTGTLSNTHVTPAGCGVLVCFTNLGPQIRCVPGHPVPVTGCFTNVIGQRTCSTNFVTVSRCFTDVMPRLICSTNGTGQLVCTTNLVTTTHCFTNTVPQLTCTTNFVTVTRCFTNLVPPLTCTTNWVPRVMCTNDATRASSVKLNQVFSGTLLPNAACDELGRAIPANAVLTALLYTDLRLADWRGLHTGSFRIVVDGTNVVAAGTVSGSNGVNHGAPNEPCAVCSHFEGVLRGFIVQPGPLHGAQLQATYAVDLGDVSCPSTSIPQGAAVMTLDGVVVVTTCPPPGPPPAAGP